MKFSEYIQLSESTKDLYAAIGKSAAEPLLKTPVDPEVQTLHNKTFGPGNHHIEIPLENDIPEKVKSHVESAGDELTDSGVKLKTGREVPLSKYLVRSKAPKEVQDEHQNWEKNKIGNSKLVITRHPGEVASASTGTHWSSCARAVKKTSSDWKSDSVPAFKAMPHELEHGTLMAMHVHKDAKPNEHGEYDSKDVMGRTLIKRHDADIESENPNEISFHREQKKYGAFPDSAKKAVDEFTSKNYPMKNMIGHKHHMLYNDDGETMRANVHHPDLEHAFTPGHDKEIGPGAQKAIVDSKDVPQKVLSAAAHSFDSKVRLVVAKKSTDPDALHKVITHQSKWGDDVRTIQPKIAALSNPHVSPKTLDAAMDHTDDRIKEAAVSHPHASDENISQGISHPSADVAQSAVLNPKAKPHHLIEALKNEDHGVRYAAITHPNVNNDVLKVGVVHPEQSTRLAAIKHEKMTPELFKLSRTVNDPRHLEFVDSQEKYFNETRKK